LERITRDELADPPALCKMSLKKEVNIVIPEEQSDIWNLYILHYILVYKFYNT